LVELTIEVSAEEVNTEANRFRVGVRAQSTQQAVDIAEVHYPGAAVRVVFSIDPETFFVQDDVGVAGSVTESTGIKMPKTLAG
jgi:ribosomal protein S1